MRLFPVLLDCLPRYLQGSRVCSLLTMPVGAMTLLRHLRDGLAPHTAHRPRIVTTTVEESSGYEEALRTTGVDIEDVLSVSEFGGQLEAYEPSDWLLIVDSRRVGAMPPDLSSLTDDLAIGTRAVRHLVALQDTSAGTSERVLLDEKGRVSRIQRYYESVTWPFVSGVVASLVPAAATRLLESMPLSSLPALRLTLATAGVPSRDFFSNSQVFDLEKEAGLLGLNESILTTLDTSAPLIAPSAFVDPEAILRGPVVIQEDAIVQGRTAVIGPAVIGPRSHVGSGSVIAQCIVAPDTVVPERTVNRQHVVVEESPREHGAAAGIPAPDDGWPDLQEVTDDNPILLGPPLKRGVDTVIAFLALVALSPLFALIGFLIKLDSRGRVLFGHERESFGGRQFRCWKFRTMHQDADARERELVKANQVDGPQFKITDDPRVTRVGRALRRLNLDELPQLINVVTGDMSLVGPRPSPFRENQLCVPWREARLSVRPGITGLWQICRNKRSSGDFHQWIYYDMLYVRERSLVLDAKILVATVLSLAGRFAVPVSWLVSPASLYDRRRTERRPGDPDLSSFRRTA